MQLSNQFTHRLTKLMKRDWKVYENAIVHSCTRTLTGWRIRQISASAAARVPSYWTALPYLAPLGVRLLAGWVAGLSVCEQWLPRSRSRLVFSLFIMAG